MFEVMVMSSGSNVAVGKSATQSSTFKRKFPAANAIDGVASGKSFSHTNPSVNKFGWWEVNLNGAFKIDSILIKNRYCRSVDDQPGCLCRLSHSAVVLLDSNGNWVASQFIGDTCGEYDVNIVF